MEIERISDNTVKLYISYIDLEERGFDREEIWFNRDLGEELFWEMMEEADTEGEFLGDGPLWIQIAALDSGLEMLVTKSSFPKNEDISVSVDSDKPMLNAQDLMNSSRERIEEIWEEYQSKLKNRIDRSDDLDFVLSFADFEDVIQLANKQNFEHIKTTLYSFENKYYLYISFDEENNLDEHSDIVENTLSILLEYGVESDMTHHRLEEYGSKIITEHVFQTIKQHFS